MSTGKGILITVLIAAMVAVAVVLVNNSMQQKGKGGTT